MIKSPRTTVTFQSARFNTTEQRNYFVNPDCFGDDLCQWLIDSLTAKNVQCDDKPTGEDWGWCFAFQVGNSKYTFNCNFRPADGNDPAVWVGFIQRDAGFLGSFLGGADKNIAPQAPQLINAALRQSPDITHILWHQKEHFDRGQESCRTPEP